MDLWLSSFLYGLLTQSVFIISYLLYTHNKVELMTPGTNCMYAHNMSFFSFKTF